MKVFSKIVKILTALAAIAGAVYAIATYGDKIVAERGDARLLVRGIRGGA